MPGSWCVRPMGDMIQIFVTSTIEYRACRNAATRCLLARLDTNARAHADTSAPRAHVAHGRSWSAMRIVIREQLERCHGNGSKQFTRCSTACLPSMPRMAVLTATTLPTNGYRPSSLQKRRHMCECVCICVCACLLCVARTRNE